MTVGKTTQLQIRVSPAEKAGIRRAAGKAGMDVSTWVLAQLLPPPALRFQQLVAGLAEAPSPRFATAELHDFLQALSSSEFTIAVENCPFESLDPYRANYLAAMVEFTGHRLQLPAPEWTRCIAPLAEPAFGAGLQSLRLHLLTQSPIPFRRRNIFIDSTIGDRV